MKAFISYSHKDAALLEKLHTHLSQLKRDGQLTSWTDEDILAGGSVSQDISQSLESAQIFLALLSPDYIASQYCYEKEFQRALQLHESGKLTIVPIILEPCDWLNTPFKAFKALPKDGKAISIWQNTNTAFLDVIQNIRKLLSGVTEGEPMLPKAINTDKPIAPSRNYRVKRDFDSIQKIEFTEQSFTDIRKTLGDYIEELLQVDDQIKCRITKNEVNDFEAILVNRNKIGSEATLKLTVPSKQRENGNYIVPLNVNGGIKYVIKSKNNSEGKTFSLSMDDFHMYWEEEGSNYHNRQHKELEPKEIVDLVWQDWLESVGII